MKYNHARFKLLSQALFFLFFTQPFLLLFTLTIKHKCLPVEIDSKLALLIFEYVHSEHQNVFQNNVKGNEMITALLIREIKHQNLTTRENFKHDKQTWLMKLLSSTFHSNPGDKFLYPWLLPERIQVASYLHMPTQIRKLHHCWSRGGGRSSFLSANLPLISRKGSSSSDISLSLQYLRKRSWFPRSSPLLLCWSFWKFAWPGSPWPLQDNVNIVTFPGKVLIVVFPLLSACWEYHPGYFFLLYHQNTSQIQWHNWGVLVF